MVISSVNARATAFAAGTHGAWSVLSVVGVIGASLSVCERLDRLPANQAEPGTVWTLLGVASAARYVERPEQKALQARQEGLGRPNARCAALIPIRKSESWWQMSQDERRDIFERRSRHIADSLAYLPQIARQLYHSRDLGQDFDFLTWFEYAPEDSDLFERLLDHLRATPEWAYVEREVDIRLTRAA